MTPAMRNEMAINVFMFSECIQSTMTGCVCCMHSVFQFQDIEEMEAKWANYVKMTLTMQVSNKM